MLNSLPVFIFLSSKISVLPRECSRSDAEKIGVRVGLRGLPMVVQLSWLRVTPFFSASQNKNKIQRDLDIDIKYQHRVRFSQFYSLRAFTREW